MMKKKSLQIQFIEYVRTKLRDKVFWTQSLNSRDVNGMPVGATSPAAICWTLKGALNCAYDEISHANANGDISGVDRAYNDVRQTLRDVIIARFPFRFHPSQLLFEFNTHTDTTFVDLQAVLQDVQNHFEQNTDVHESVMAFSHDTQQVTI